jgi:radical SAM/Cys-rich protein
MPGFQETLAAHGRAPLTRARPSWLQLNLGRRCNQACAHCHVDASPTRTEQMDDATVEAVLRVLRDNPELKTFDLTGGAPELHPRFRELVRAGRAWGREVIDRCNLTILSEPGHEDLADFLASEGVHVIASLPCYLEDNVDRQRGRGVFQRSLAGLRALNERGFGREPGRVIDLVYNPVGAHLPPGQAGLQADYSRRLLEEHGVVFNELLTITNMPIARFLADLKRQGKVGAYQELLVQAFNPSTIDGLMCRHLISVGWDGRLYDCDFNQMLELEAPVGERTVHELGATGEWAGRPIATAPHCFGCTAGAGSSCGGALA